MRRYALDTIVLVAVLAFASQAAAATCKCKPSYSPYGAPAGWAPHQMLWECVRKPGTYPRGHPPSPLPCNGQSKRGPA